MYVWMHADATEGLLEIHCPIWELFHVESADEPQRRFPRQPRVAERSSTFVIFFTTADETGKRRSLEGKEKDGKRKNVWSKGNVEDQHFWVSRIETNCVSSSTIYTYIHIYIHCYFQVPPLLSSPPLFLVRQYFRLFLPLGYSLQYPVPFCITHLIYRFFLFRTHLAVLKNRFLRT